MNVQFLKEISEAYIIDSNVNETQDHVFEKLYDIVKFLQEYDLSLYNELYETTSLKKQQILKTYLDDIYYEQEEIINEMTLEVPASIILGFICFLLFGKTALTQFANILSSIGKVIEGIGNVLRKRGKYWQIRYSIVYDNTKKCYTKCGINKLSDIKMLTPFSIAKKQDLQTDFVQQGECLRECYINELIEVIALHMENYFACLKRTGSFEAIRSSNSDDVIKLIASTNISATCETYYDMSKELLDTFYRVLDLVYIESDLRLEKVNKLRSAIYASKQKIEHTNEKDMNRYNGEKFPSQTNNNQSNNQSFDNKTRIGGQHYNPNFKRR